MLTARKGANDEMAARICAGWKKEGNGTASGLSHQNIGVGCRLIADS